MSETTNKALTAEEKILAALKTKVCLFLIKKDRKMLVSGKNSFTGPELATEIENATETGERFINRLLLLGLELFSIEKSNLPEPILNYKTFEEFLNEECTSVISWSPNRIKCTKIAAEKYADQVTAALKEENERLKKEVSNLTGKINKENFTHEFVLQQMDNSHRDVYYENKKLKGQLSTMVEALDIVEEWYNRENFEPSLSWFKYVQKALTAYRQSQNEKGAEG